MSPFLSPLHSGVCFIPYGSKLFVAGIVPNDPGPLKGTNAFERSAKSPDPAHTDAFERSAESSVPAYTDAFGRSAESSAHTDAFGRSAESSVPAYTDAFEGSADPTHTDAFGSSDSDHLQDHLSGHSKRVEKWVDAIAEARGEGSRSDAPYMIQESYSGMWPDAENSSNDLNINSTQTSPGAPRKRRKRDTMLRLSCRGFKLRRTMSLYL